MHVIRVHIGLPQRVDFPDKAVTTAFFKQPAGGPIWLRTGGLEGDGQANRKHHGGPDKALLACGLPPLQRWAEILSRPDLGPGAFGENLTLSDAEEDEICIGDRFALGDAVIEVTQPREPCRTLARALRVPDLVARMREQGGCGFYLRVCEEGRIAQGQEVHLLLRPNPGYTVAQAIRKREAARRARRV